MSQASSLPSPFSLKSMSMIENSESDLESLSSAVGLDNETGDEHLMGVSPNFAHTNASATATLGVKHPRFFYGGGCINFLVEGSVYRVPDCLFTMHSTYWSERLAESNDDGATVELKDTTARDMDAFLSLLYNVNFPEYEVGNVEDWRSVLRLSSAWKFERFRALAIEKLAPLTAPLEKLVLSRAFNIPSWLQPAFVALCARDKPLTLAECNQLSMKDVADITCARETLRTRTRVIVDEEEATAYVTANILCSEKPPPVSEGAARSAPAALNTDASLHADLKGSSSTASDSSAPVELMLLLEKPSGEVISHLIKTLLDSDYDGAVAMVTEKGVQTFVDTIRDFTNLKRKPDSRYLLVDAIFRRGAREVAFIPVGAHLLFKLKPIFYDGHVAGDVQYRAQLLKSVCEKMDRVRALAGNFNLAIRLALEDKASMQFFNIIDPRGPSCITVSVFDERCANLKSLISCPM